MTLMSKPEHLFEYNNTLGLLNTDLQNLHFLQHKFTLKPYQA
jgi:hypothetical protein